VSSRRPLDLETRIAILRALAQNERVQLGDAELAFLAVRAAELRDLDELLMRVVAFSRLTGMQITVALCNESLKKTSQSGEAGEPGAGEQSAPIARGPIRDRREATHELDTSVLSPKEREILELLKRGLSTREIAEATAISPVTARRHISMLARKAGARSREDLIQRGGGRVLPFPELEERRRRAARELIGLTEKEWTLAAQLSLPLFASWLEKRLEMIIAVLRRPDADDPPDSCVREPRRPRPSAPGGSVALELPEDDALDSAGTPPEASYG